MEKKHPEKRLLNVKETAQILGISPRSIYNQVARKAKKRFPIKVKRIGRLIRFDLRDVEKYIENLAQFIAGRRITIEVCLTSNLQTNPSLQDLKNRSFAKMVRRNICTVFCTDNRTVSKTNVTKEIMLAIKSFPLSGKTLRNCLTYGFKRSFFPGDYSEKRKYVRKCLDYYDKVTEGLTGF